MLNTLKQAGKKQVFARAELYAQTGDQLKRVATGDQLKRVATGDAILVPVQ